MIKFLLFILFFVFTVPVFADDFFDAYTGVDNAWDGQKVITDKEFEQAIDTLTAKQKKKEEKQKKKKIKKISGGGTSLHQGIEPTNSIPEQDILKEKSKNDGQLLNIPVSFIVDGKILEPGFYNIFGEKDDNNDIYLSFYQSRYFMGKVKAHVTQNDFDSETLDFVKMIPYDNTYLKIVYGSLKFNAYAYVKYME